MQTKSQRALYYELELIPTSSTKTEDHGKPRWWAAMWSTLANALMASSEPKVWFSTDWFGHTWWNIYLPKTGRTVRFSSQEEARIWLEQNRYSI